MRLARRPLLARLLAALPALVLAPVLALSATPTVAAPPTLRLITHDSFELPAELLARFETQAGVKLSVIKAGDAGAMLNKLVLTKDTPLADVVFGLDNASVARARQAGILDDYDGPASRAASRAELGPGVVPIDVGHVTINIDKAWFAQRRLALPTRLQDLTQPAYRKLMVVPSPATSSPGFAFLASTLTALGEDAGWAWWQQMRANGLKVTKGWSEAYFTDFTRNGGSRPIVLSYATSPAAEVAFSKTPLSEAPTASLELRGAVFRQVEGVALVHGGGQREAAGRFIEFLRSPEVQAALQTSFWMWPADPQAPVVEALSKHARWPEVDDTPSPERLAADGPGWIRRWTRTVLK